MSNPHYSVGDEAEDLRAENERLRTTQDDLQKALSEAASALGRDRGRRNETIAQRITAIRAERDEAQRAAVLAAADWLERGAPIAAKWLRDDYLRSSAAREDRP